MTDLRLIKFDDKTFGTIPLVIATSQLTDGGGLTDSLRRRLHRALEEARKTINFWEWSDENTLSQSNWLSLRITPEETKRFCEQVIGFNEDVTKGHLIDALVSVSTVLGIVYESEDEIYTTVIDGAGYGFSVKICSWVDPAFERVEAKFRDSTSGPHPVGISGHLKPGCSGYDLVSQYTAWTITYCNLRDLRVDDFLDSFARFEEI